MKTVGLTGGIACGKSTVAGLLRARGVPVVDADQVSRQVVAPGSPGLAELVAAFGPELLAADGSLDRAALGARVMSDPQARRRLETITHPHIAAGIMRALAELSGLGHPVAVVEAALMVETGSFRAYDGVLLVWCSPEVQRRRLAARQGWDLARADAWIAAQLPLAEKRARLAHAAREGGPALAIVDNDGALDDLRPAVERAWAALSDALGFSR